MNAQKPAAVFILLGQSNAVGHAVPMKAEDIIETPLKNVFGLSRTLNQSFDQKQLFWEGYSSGGMNLAEAQDHTYSVANCLARLWQDEIDAGNPNNLPDLYIIQIAISGQGVTEKFMWYPEREKKLIPGGLGKVNISLFPFAEHIFSLVNESLAAKGLVPKYLMHWRGGEEDCNVSVDGLKKNLKNIYEKLFSSFQCAIGEKIKIVLHLLICEERIRELEPKGYNLQSMHYINSVFEELQRENESISLFDVRTAPHYIPDTREHGLFIEDAVHYTPETNRWVAKEILERWKMF